jgi:hypothetical protein
LNGYKPFLSLIKRPSEMEFSLSEQAHYGQTCPASLTPLTAAKAVCVSCHAALDLFSACPNYTMLLLACQAIFSIPSKI